MHITAAGHGSRRRREHVVGVRGSKLSQTRFRAAMLARIHA